MECGGKEEEEGKSGKEEEEGKGGKVGGKVGAGKVGAGKVGGKGKCTFPKRFRRSCSLCSEAIRKVE